MVASQDQYKLIYSLLEEYLTVSDAVQSVHQFLSTDPEDERFVEEFDKLNKIRPILSQGDCAAAHRVENRSKNR